MEIQQMFKVLGLVGSVTSSDWNKILKIVEQISTIEVKEKEWADPTKNEHPEFYPLDLSNISIWSTYQDCVELKFSVIDSKLYCHVRLYEGDNLTGMRKRMRFIATLIMPDSFIKEIDGYIYYALSNFLENAYEEHLNSQKIIWMETMKAEILK